MSRVAGRRVAVVAGFALAFALVPVTARAQDDVPPSTTPTTAPSTASVTGPSVRVDRERVRPGGAVVVAVEGFTAGAVTVTVCGNEGRRGSADCAMSASEGLRTDDAGTASVRMPVASPPAPCPCILRASSRGDVELATVGIVLVGHPTAPVVDGDVAAAVVEVGISASAAPEGLVDAVRAELGGPSAYDVTVTVRNRSTFTVRAARVSSSFGRSDDDVIGTLDFDVPSSLAPGQTWSQTVTATAPAPGWGRLSWRAVVSGAGPAVSASASTTQRPLLLVVFVLLVVADVGVLLVRWRVRRHVARAPDAALLAAP